MKKSKSYFGNRFNTALRSIRSRKRNSQISVLPAPVAAASEFEALEGRILLSGLTDGTRVLKSFTFTDADGDRVSIKVTGQVARGAGFQVTDLGNGFDVDEINLVGLTSKNSLAITVTPARISATSQTTTGGAIWTPGYTNIGSIVSDVQTTNTGAATTVAAGLRNLGINAAVVADINLPATDILGSISVATGKTAWLDRINTVSAATAGQNADGYNPVAGLIDLGDVTAKSIGRITINGIISSPTNSPFGNDTNDLNGTVSVSGNLGGITALRSSVNGDVNVGGNLGKIQVGDFNGNINVGGNLSIVLPDGGKGTITAGGHINLGFAPGTTWANVTAGAGISGIQASLTDTINVPSDYVGTLSNLSTASTAGSGIANIQVTGSTAADFTLVSGNSIGNLSASTLGAMNVTSGAGGIGNITTTSGELAGTYNSGGNIGNISANSVTDGISGTFTAAGSIGNIVATSLDGNAISGTFTAANSIGTITATSTVGGDAITGKFTSTLGDIGAILANANGTAGGDAINTASFTAAGSIASITANANGGDALNGVTATADSDNSNVGAIGNITATSFAGDAIFGGAYQGASIGNITANVTGLSGTGEGISGFATFTGVTNTETAAGSTKFNNLGTIGNISVTNASTNAVANGIENADFNAGAAGKIGNISVSAVGGAAIIDGDFRAWDGSLGGGDTLFTSTIGTVTVSKAGGAGISGLSDFQANAGIGAISVTSSGNGIAASTFDGDDNFDGTGGIGAITVAVSGANSFGITGSNFDGASIGNIAVTLSATGGTGDAINGSSFTAVTNTETAAGSGKFNNLGTIGTITVNNASTDANADGLVGGSFTAGAAGSIGAISVTTAGGNGIDSTDFATVLSAGGQDTIVSGGIGAVSVTSAAAGIISGATFNAVAGVGAINVTAATDALDGITVNADTNNDGTGGIASITATSATGTAISGGTYTGATIGNITANVTSAASLSDVIDGATFTASNIATAGANKNDTGTIGNISVTNAGTDAGAAGIVNGASFTAGAAGSIGTISVTTAGGDGIDTSAFLTKATGTDAVLTGNINQITVNSAARGIVGSTIEAEGGVAGVTVTSVGAGVTGTSIDADLSGDGTGALGNVSITVSGTAGIGLDTSAAGYVYGATVGNISVSLTDAKNASQAVLGSGTTDIESGLGSIDTITISTAGTGAAADSLEITADGSVGAITLTGAATNLEIFANAAVAKNGTIGAISISGDASLTAKADTTIGNVSVGGASTLTLEVSQAKATIGSISGTGTGNQSVTINGLASTVVGNVNFAALDDADTVTLVVNNAEAIGNITIEAATAKNVANLALDANELVTVGDITVDGQLTLTTDLVNAETIGDFTIGSFAAVPAGGSTIGAGTAQTAAVGLITIGADLADNAGDRYVFDFDDYNGVDTATATIVATVAAQDFATADMPVNTTAGGIRFILA